MSVFDFGRNGIYAGKDDPWGQPIDLEAAAKLIDEIQERTNALPAQLRIAPNLREPLLDKFAVEQAELAGLQFTLMGIPVLVDPGLPPGTYQMVSQADMRAAQLAVHEAIERALRPARTRVSGHVSCVLLAEPIPWQMGTSYFCGERPGGSGETMLSLSPSLAHARLFDTEYDARVAADRLSRAYGRMFQVIPIEEKADA